MHIQSRGYTEDTHTKRRHKYIAEYTHYTFRAEHAESRGYTVQSRANRCGAEDGTEQRQAQSRGRNAKQRQAQALIPKEKQAVHIQNIFKDLYVRIEHRNN